MKNKYIAHCESMGETEYFGTFEAAEKWLKECWQQEANQGEGIAGETIDGMDYIAKITHRSGFKETDNRKNYCPDDECEACGDGKCNLEQWPYDNQFDVVGDAVLLEVEE